MYRKIDKREKKWIDSLLNTNFKGKEILQEQVLHARVSCEEEYAYISLKFKVEAEIERFPYKVRVPVEMRAFQELSAPIIFLLHVMNGFIDELEIITADSSRLDPDNITLNKVEYEINEEVISKTLTLN